MGGTGIRWGRAGFRRPAAERVWFAGGFGCAGRRSAAGADVLLRAQTAGCEGGGSVLGGPAAGFGRLSAFSEPAEIAHRYGASPATRRAFVAAITRLGLRASIDPSGVFARVRGTQARLERAFHVKITSLPDETATLYQANRPLRLPATVRPLVREVIATFERTVRPVKGTSRRLIARTPPPLRTAAPGPKNEGTWTRGCAAARRLGGYSFGQIRHAYGIDKVGAGAGGSVAILNDEESILPSDGVATARCFHYPAGRVQMLFTDSETSRFNPDTPEPIEDLSLVRGIAPQLRRCCRPACGARRHCGSWGLRS